MNQALTALATRKWTSVEIETAGNRIVKTNFQLQLYGYLIPDTIQKELTAVKKLSNSTQLIFNMETVDRLPEEDFSSNSQKEIQTDNNPSSFIDKA